MRRGAAPPNAGEQALLRTVIRSLEAAVLDPDPKVEVILHYLRNRDWLRSHGAILFSQYFTTAEWIALRLADVFPVEPFAIYAGGGRSSVIRGGIRQLVDRDKIKKEVQ